MKVKGVKRRTFFGRLLRSPIINGVLDVLPFGKIISNVKQVVSTSEQYKHKNPFYFIGYIITGVLMWLFITGKIDASKMDYLFSFIIQLIN